LLLTQGKLRFPPFYIPLLYPPPFREGDIKGETPLGRGRVKGTLFLLILINKRKGEKAPKE
jgi:hypothetical protein